MSSVPSDRPPKRHTAGAFDLRNFIGMLLGIYALVLIAMGLFGDRELAKTGGVNANLWCGIALALAAGIFFLWAKLRPTVVPEHNEHNEHKERDDSRPAAH